MPKKKLQFPLLPVLNKKLHSPIYPFPRKSFNSRYWWNQRKARRKWTKLQWCWILRRKQREWKQWSAQIRLVGPPPAPAISNNHFLRHIPIVLTAHWNVKRLPLQWYSMTRGSTVTSSPPVATEECAWVTDAGGKHKEEVGTVNSNGELKLFSSSRCLEQ